MAKVKQKITSLSELQALAAQTTYFGVSTAQRVQRKAKSAGRKRKRRV
jgi:hypothetical protein